MVQRGGLVLTGVPVQVVIKYVPYVGDSKRALDEYTSEIMMGGTNTIVIHNTCEVRGCGEGGGRGVQPYTRLTVTPPCSSPTLRTHCWPAPSSWTWPS